jgi:hypothetical protein
MKLIPNVVLAPIPVLLALCSCGGEGGTSETMVVDSAGVALVTGVGEDRPLPWSVEEVLRIRPLEEEGDGFFGVREVAVLEGDRIAVLDGDAKRVVVYDEHGTFLAQYGREGSGPGEFQMPFEMAAAPDGGVVVYDVMNRRLERFDATLVPGASDPLQVSYFGGHLDYAGPFLVVPTRSAMDPERNTQTLLAVSASDTVEVVRYEREVGKPVTFESCGMSISGMGPLFEARTLWAAGPDGTVLVAGTSRYEVDIFRQPSFELERRIRRAVPAIEADAAMAEASIGDAMRVMAGGQERICDASEVAEKRGFAPVVPPVAAMVVAPSGEIYLQRWALEEEDRVIDVLSPEGEYMGTLAGGLPFPEAFLGDDRFVVTEEDELGLASVVVYRIVK